jgi:hypothetical protein
MIMRSCGLDSVGLGYGGAVNVVMRFWILDFFKYVSDIQLFIEIHARWGQLIPDGLINPFCWELYRSGRNKNCLSTAHYTHINS